MSRTVELTVARSSREYAASSASMLYVDPEVMAKQGWQAGELLRVSTYRREILARMDAASDEERGSGQIHLDRFQRQALQVRLFAQVECERQAGEPAVTVVHLQPAVDLTSASAHHMEEHLKEELVKKRSPVSLGALLFLHFHHSVAGTLYKVTKLEPGSGVVNGATDVVLDSAPEGFLDGIGLDITFEDLGGLDREIAQVKELVQVPLQFPALYRQVGIPPVRGIILYGPPGTGKTLLARATANEVEARFYYINGPEIVGSTYGESEGNLRRIFGEAIHHAPSVIFIDELDAIAIKRGESGSHSDTRLVTQLLSLMDGLTKVDGVIVMGTTNRMEAIDMALRRPGRFDYELYIGPPDAAGREQILNIHTREMPLDKEARAYLPKLAADTHGFVGADLMALCRTAGLQALRRRFQPGHEPYHVHELENGEPHHLHQSNHTHHFHPELLRVGREDLTFARRQSRPSAGRATMVVTPEHGFEMIAGLSAAKARLQASLIHPLRSGQMITDGVLLHGPSGVGKSALAKGVAREAGVNLIVVGGAELFSKWLGESEEAVRHVFKVAHELSPCLIFFDQLDSIAPIRGRNTGSWTTERVVHQFLAELDELSSGGFVAAIAATNRLDLVDPAILQPGRFGTLIRLELPDTVERQAILALHLRESVHELSDKARAQLGIWTEGWTGAQLHSFAEFLKREPGSVQNGNLERVFRRWQDQNVMPTDRKTSGISTHTSKT